MATSLLVLGGSHFVGRALVEDGLARGWSVTTFSRGRTGTAHPDAEHLTGDRLDPAALAPLGARDWDVVADTWAGAPRATRDICTVLTGRAGGYAYISSRSVYAWPPAPGADERAPTVEGSPDAEDGDYTQRKRGSELAVQAAFGERALLARPGLVLGPHEDVGRLPWWLERIARGGDVLAPGPPELGLQLIDARDLAHWVLDAAAAGLHGPFDTVSRPAHTTMRGLLEACVRVTGSDARLRWTDPEAILAAGIEPWTELPIWLPSGPDRALHEGDTTRAHEAGLRCRPAEETVADTWAWLEEVGHAPPLRPDLPPPGLDPAREAALLERLAGT